MLYVCICICVHIYTHTYIFHIYLYNYNFLSRKIQRMTLRTKVHQFNIRFVKCSSFSGLLNDNGTRTVRRSCIMRRCWFLVEVLNSFRRKIGVSFSWGTANHYGLWRTAKNMKSFFTCHIRLKIDSTTFRFVFYFFNILK